MAIYLGAERDMLSCADMEGYDYVIAKKPAIIGHYDLVRYNNARLNLFIFRARKPVKLFHQLKNSGIVIVSNLPGVYNIKGIINIPVNIIAINELEDSELNAISIMTYNAREEIVRQFLKEANSFTESGDKRSADAVLQISVGINREIFERLKGESKMCEALRELMADELQEAETTGIQKGERIGIEKRDRDKISEMLALGRKPEDISAFCNYPLDQVMKIYNDMFSNKK
ncbi:hypothetical protein [Butyrivibrio sp. YAB3001]|uniref:hypothetical protein n=1 Tax=Butyrivibrio sp. YAB3001 TaxID=1520812 RepID=UPI0008F67869|nr:hypothetical protein [Butyrivibrio sp. YAB3001]SFD06763.1 hypothetical protein SAMN02910398_03954 [Butyrivibrio sp. YAB3001]